MVKHRMLAYLAFRSKKFFHFHRDCIVLGVVIPLASVLAGFAIFTVLGHASYITSVPIDQLPNSGWSETFLLKGKHKHYPKL